MTLLLLLLLSSIDLSMVFICILVLFVRCGCQRYWLNFIYNLFGIGIHISLSLCLELVLVLRSLHLAASLLFILKFYHRQFDWCSCCRFDAAYKTVHFTPHVSFRCAIARFFMVARFVFIHLLVQMSIGNGGTKKESAPKNNMEKTHTPKRIYMHKHLNRARADAPEREREGDHRAQVRGNSESGMNGEFMLQILAHHRQQLKQLQQNHRPQPVIDARLSHRPQTKSHIIIMRSKCKLIMHTDVPDYIPILHISLSLSALFKLAIC